MLSYSALFRRADREAEGARLLSEYTPQRVSGVRIPSSPPVDLTSPFPSWETGSFHVRALGIRTPVGAQPLWARIISIRVRCAETRTLRARCAKMRQLRACCAKRCMIRPPLLFLSSLCSTLIRSLWSNYSKMATCSAGDARRMREASRIEHRFAHGARIERHFAQRVSIECFLRSRPVPYVFLRSLAPQGRRYEKNFSLITMSEAWARTTSHEKSSASCSAVRGQSSGAMPAA